MAKQKAWVLLSLLLACGLSGGVARGEENLRATAKLLKSREAEDRERALGRLQEMSDRTSLLLILDALRDEDPRVRARARRSLGARRSPVDLEIVARRGTRHGHPEVRVAVYRHLAEAGAPGLAELVERALSDADPGVREAAAALFVRYLGGRDPDELAAAALRGRAGRPRAAALLALGALDGARARPLATRLTDDPEFEVRVAALETLADGPGEEAFPHLLSGLSDPSWSVRLTAVRAVGESGQRDGVPALVLALRREDGRMREEVGESLARLTGVGLPPDPEAWEAWWEKEGGSFTPEKNTRPATAESGESAATFHSIPFRSRCVAFVLDRSRSMRDRLERGDEKTKGQLVEAELRSTLARLAPPARFLLVSFGTEAETFTPRPVTASGAARQRALRWFGKRRPHGRTNIFDALALTLAQDQVDTVFLLTDGSPTAGAFQTRTEITAELRRLNRYRKAVIHTVEIGAEATGKRWRGFLEDLAALSGGRHVRR